MKKNLILIIAVLATILLPQSGLYANNESQYSPNITYAEPMTHNLTEGYGIYSEYCFWNIYAGWNGTIPFTIFNGPDKDRTFALSVVEATNPKEGYEALPSSCLPWVTISEPMVSLNAGDTYNVPVAIAIPPDVDYTRKYAEADILVEDLTQTGLVQIALKGRFLISTESEPPALLSESNTLFIMVCVVVAAIAVSGAILLRRKKMAIRATQKGDR